jgi:AcrR family transcriptional regulator
MASKTPRDARTVVMESAIQEFARKGFSGTSVQDILRATGLSKPTLYYYFENKAGLFRAILDSAFDECLSRMQANVAGAGAKGFEAKLVAVSRAMFEFSEEHPQLLRLVFSTAFAAPEEIPADCLGMEKRIRNFEFAKKIFEEALDQGELLSKFSAAELAHGLFGAISHQCRMHLLRMEGKLTPRTAARLVELFLNGARSK